MKDNISPEEKLLRLIRGQKKAGLTIEDKCTPVLHGAALKLKAASAGMSRQVLPFAQLSVVIRPLFLFSFLFLLFSFVYPFIGLGRLKVSRPLEGKAVDLQITQPRDIKPLETYLQGVSKRQIFGTMAAEEVQIPLGAVDTDITKDINLVGIISGEVSQAAIEDKKTQKTYYVSKGQSIGEFQVEDIQEGKIILNFNGQRVELNL
ncbi:MAG: hypothetical protein HZB36_07375 [Candidatus Omnitrophica bacterium]|nr:hypothetical protein [Candidatus Omnitrophota bacterium]